MSLPPPKNHSLCRSCLWAPFSVSDGLIWFTSIALTTVSGALLGAPVADLLGRRLGIISSCLVFSAGVAMQTAATALPLFVVGRVFAGLGVGLVSVLIPMYQSEW